MVISLHKSINVAVAMRQITCQLVIVYPDCVLGSIHDIREKPIRDLDSTFKESMTGVTSSSYPNFMLR